MFTHKTKDEVDVALKQYYEAEMKKIADQIALNVQKNEIEHQGRVLKYSQQFLDLQNVAAKQVAEFEHTFPADHDTYWPQPYESRTCVGRRPSDAAT